MEVPLLWQLKLIGGSLLIAWVIFTTLTTIKSFTNAVDTAINPPRPDTVYMSPDTIEVVIEEANSPRKPNLVERFTTRVLPPDTVYIAKSDTAYPNVPDYGIQKVEKERKQLVVTSLRRDGTEAQKSVYTLPEENTDYLLTSGVTPSTLTVDRTWKVVDLEAELLVVAGTNGINVAAVGPVNVNVTPNLSVSPAVLANADGWGVGAAVHLEF